MAKPKGSKSRIPFRVWTQEEKDYLSVVCSGNSYKKIAELMTNEFCREYNDVQIKGALRRYGLKTGTYELTKFKKGHTTWNKGKKGYMGSNETSFKKGNIPHNYKQIGTEIIDPYGYAVVKVGDPDVWKKKHVLLWEEENGDVPKGSIVIFGDGDKTNLDKNNLICVNRNQLARLNQNGMIYDDADFTKTALNVVNVMLKINEVKRRK